MRGLKSFRAPLVAVGVAVSALAAGTCGASAAVVEHQGVIFSDLTIGGLNFSRIYTGDDQYGGGRNFRRLGTIYNENTGQSEVNDVPISYEWDTQGDNQFSAGDTASFVSPFSVDTLVYSEQYSSWSGNEYRYDVTLLESAESVLTIGQQLLTPVNGGGAIVTNTVSGQLKFKIDRYKNGNLMASLTDFVSFDDQLLFSVVNGALESDTGGVQMFLWGDTFDGNEGSYPGDIPQEWETISYGGHHYRWKKPKKKLVDMEDEIAYSCSGYSKDCDKIVKEFYGEDDQTMVWKVALSGSAVPSVVPVPAALPLLISAIFGLGLVARRRT